MKKLIAIVAIAAFITSCNSGFSNTESTSDSSMADKKMMQTLWVLCLLR